MSNHKLKLISVFFMAASMVFCTNNNNNSKNATNKNANKPKGKSIFESEDAKKALNKLEQMLRSMQQKGSLLLVELIISEGTLEDLFEIKSLEAKIRKLQPSVQKKIMDSDLQQQKDNDTVNKKLQELQKDPEVKALNELFQKMKLIEKQKQLVMLEAVKIFRNKVQEFGLQVLIKVDYASQLFIDEEKVESGNHILLLAQKVYEFCLIEAFNTVKKEMEEAQKQQKQGTSGAELQSKVER